MSSLGGNMNYIYGNTLVLGDSSYLAHHGILGQKWGIRRFQNKDGSRTAEGKKRYKTMQAAHGTRARGNSPFDRAKNRAIDKAKDEFNELLDNARYGKNKAKYDAAVDEWDKAQTHRYDEYEKEFDKYASIAGMANAYRCGWDQPNAGFGSRDNMLEFATEFYKYDDGDQGKFNSYDYFLVGKGENPNDVQDKAFKASSAMWELAKEDAKDLFGDLADKKDGPGSTVATSFASSMFNYATAASPITMVDESSGLRYTDQEIKQMQEDIRKFSVEAKRLGTISHSGVFVENGTLYLCHHGIKNQKWGIRRFQNPDGSLTAAGRIRYGVTGAAKAAFKVGKKIGAATASAARAGVKKANDNAYEKKKEKASQTREGVLKNKKMFTNEELKRLEERFKIEDDMRNAGLRHGQEIAKTISAYSDAAVKTMNALQTGGKAVKAISDGLSALQDYKEKRDIGKKASDAGMSTADYKDYTKSRMEDKAKRDNERAQKKAEEAEKMAAEYKEKQAQAKAEAEAKAKADKEEAERQSIEKSKEVARRQKQDIMDTIAAKKQAKADAEQAKKDQAAAERKEQRALKKEAAERKALDKVNRIKAEDARLKSAIKNSVAGTNKETNNSIRSAIQSIIKSTGSSKFGLDKLKKMAKDHAEDVKDSPDVDAVNDAYLKKLQSLLNNIKHSDMDELEHFGVKGMKWGKHLMAGKGGSTDIFSGGGGGSPEEEDDETIADILGIDVDAYRQKINEGPFGYGQYADQLGEKAEKLHAQADANRKMADQVGLTGNKKKAAEFRKKSEQLEKDAVKAEKFQTYMNRRANGESALGITADTVNTTIVKPITGLAKDIGRSVSASNPMNSYLVRKLRRVKHGSMDSFMIENGILRYGFDDPDHLEHHGIKGQRWGVRRFQNADGSLTDKGRKHYQKKLALEERKLTAANAARGRYERVRTPMSVGMGIIGAVAGAMAGVPAGPAGIAAGAAFVSSIAASSTYAEYTVKGVFAGHGANRSKKKIAKYKEALAQDAFEIQNGVLIYGSGQSSELKHFGLKGMKWGVRRFQNKDGSLTDAGKKRYSNTGELDGGGGGGGGAPEEEDEETKKAIEEAAKKAGMTVDEYRKKFADKVAALKEKARDAAWDARYAAEDAADAVTGKTSKQIAEKSAKSAEENERKAKAARKEGQDEDAAKYEEWAKQSREISEYRQGKYEKSLAGRVEATSRKIGAKAQEAKDKLKSRAPKRSIALEVANTGPVPVGQTEIHTADVLNKYYGAMARARKTAANSTAAQRAKYGDRQNIRERAEAEELNNLRAKEKRDEAIRLRMAKKFDKKADSARAHGNIAKAEAFEKESNRQFNKAPVSGSKAEAFEAVRDSKLASHLVRNAATAKQAQSATLAENRNRNAAHLAERRREKAINEAKAKIRSGKLPVNELTRYAKSSVGQLKSAAKAELARREREQALTSMGSDYARATARITTTSSTTNTADARNEKLARDRRDKRKQAARASATAKKNRLAGSGRKKYTSGQTSSIGRVGSGRGKTSTRR